MEWSKYQLAIFDAYENTNKNIVVEATAGCLGKDTPILMYDGSIKPVQDIRVGDKVMGVDSTPRNVLSVSTGIDKLYKIKPVKGDSWICNSQHLLTVYDQNIARNNKVKKEENQLNPLVDYPISKILKRPVEKTTGAKMKLQLQRTGVDFPEQELPLDPYFVGLWIAEGSKNKNDVSNFSINENDTVLINYLENFKFEGEKVSVHKRKERGCYGINVKLRKGRINPIRAILKNFAKEKGRLNIPKEYFINSQENRLNLIAGILDGDGHLDNNNCYQLITKYKEISDLVVFLCRSLGLAAYCCKKIGRIKSLNFEGEYYSISISGNTNIIPVKVERKKAKERKQIKTVLRTGFWIEEIGVGKWYGFKVDKDERFLLGDFTITHNSGKTHTLKELCNRTKEGTSCLFMAFNKSIAEELKTKLPTTVECNTFHSMGLRTLMKNFRFRMQLEENKCFSLCMELFDFRKKEYKEKMRYYFALQELWEKIRLSLCEINERNVSALCIEYDLDYENSMINDLNKINERWRKDCAKIQDNKSFKMDFPDMLWIPYNFVDEMNFPKYQVVMADEGQDLFTLQKEILQRYIKPRGRFVAVGDSKQLIYNFMGSDLDVFNSIKGMPNTICLPLSVTYRCAKKIVEKANEVFPGTECTATAKEGVVRSGDIFEAESGDFVLCRNNFPLVVAFIMLLEKGKKASIMGRDFGENLCRLMDNQSCLDDLYLLLEDKASKLKKRGLSEIAIINNASYVALKEKVSIIETLYKRFPGSFLALKQKIKNIFSDDKTDIILSTIHKSKGLEAKRVFFLNPELIPSKFAKTPKALYAEDCLKFVAITRAKEELVYCHINTEESPL
jgi:hypothetical protein